MNLPLTTATIVVVAFITTITTVSGFILSPLSRHHQPQQHCRRRNPNWQTQNRVTKHLVSLHSTASQSQEPTDEPSIQWELLNEHHVKGSWKGVW